MSENAHKILDKKDQRTNANKLAAVDQAREHNEEQKMDRESTIAQVDPTLPAKIHGNKPSHGAEVDKAIQEEEDEVLKKKGSWGPDSSN